MLLQKLYVEVPKPNVTVSVGSLFRGYLRLSEVIRMGPSSIGQLVLEEE
jgi:hypothetical protein